MAWVYQSGNEVLHETGAPQQYRYGTNLVYKIRTTVGTTEVLFDYWNNGSNQWWFSNISNSPHVISLHMDPSSTNYNKFVDYASGAPAAADIVQAGTTNLDYNGYVGDIELKDSSGNVKYKFTKPQAASWIKTFGDVGHVLTNTGNSANLTSSSWSCISIANNEYSYRTSGVAAYDIKYDVTNDQWLDDSTAGWPTHFGTSTTDSTTITPTAASQYLYLYDNNQFICEIENDGYAVSSGSGSGGGPNPLSNNSSSTSSKKVFHNFW